MKPSKIIFFMYALLISMPINAFSDYTFTYALFGWPKDLYKRIAYAPIDLSIPDKTYSVSFSHKYPGTYEFGITVDKSVPSTLETDDWDLGMYVDCLSEGQKKMSVNTLEQPPYPWRKGGRHSYPDDNGFGLFKYSVPQDLPLNKSINCTLHLAKIPSTFIKRYEQSVNFYVQNVTGK